MAGSTVSVTFGYHWKDRELGSVENVFFVLSTMRNAEKK